MIGLSSINNKQLLDEDEHDIKNYPDRGQCFLDRENICSKKTRAINFPNCCRPFLLFCNFHGLEVVTPSASNNFYVGQLRRITHDIWLK